MGLHMTVYAYYTSSEVSQDHCDPVISLYDPVALEDQSLNFVQSPSNHPGSSTIFFSIPICIFLLLTTSAGAGATDISMSVCLQLLEASFMICKDPSCSDSTLILFVSWNLFQFFFIVFTTCVLFPIGNSVQFHLQILFTTPMLQGKLINALPNVTTLA